MSDLVHVAVAVIMNKKNKVCISLRHENAHQGGLWEFPGGKVEPHESIEQTLAREINEELGVIIERSRPLITIHHSYADKTVCLHVRKVLAYHGQANGLEGQQVRWVAVADLLSYDFPSANLPVIKALQLPEQYLITGTFSDIDDFISKLHNAINKGIKLVQLRLKDDCLKDKTQTHMLVKKASHLCRQSDVKLLLNLSADYLAAVNLAEIEFAGFHVDSGTLMALSQREPGQLFSASCHNEDELRKAAQLQADFVVLSPVQDTKSHPEAAAMGWRQFSVMTENFSLPVFALGGLSEDDLEKAWSCGAQGIAAISAFWKN